MDDPSTTVSVADDSPPLRELARRASGLSPAEQRVAQVVAEAPADVVQMSVSDLAAASQTSVGSVTRFCQKLGLRGFHDLKLALARESAPTHRRLADDVAPGDDAGQIARKVLSASARALDEAVRVVDPAAVQATADALLRARRILFTAVGTSAPPAADAAYRLATLGLDAVFPGDTHLQHVTSRTLRPGDVCFAVSHTGATRETIAALRTARTVGATTAVLTSFAGAPIADSADLVLVAGSSETAYRVEAMSSRLVHLAVLDALYVTVALRHGPARDALAATEDLLTEHRY
ncbi:MurR/RpiR family transcriptional regulator [Yinghuangia seranimata]|uniref:MurR/RpiR family transcriptional regulator n=1 Tax=Yinghuangia seranimata TaxID=408067 RepID=UPI00248B8902|nr:MurR/RpiR family transcriptional regulator [Yinghuangia seranimata]MDI2130117.1 MurR/RpiR family transcriptional regulator [Yinghuangia seranimata]